MSTFLSEARSFPLELQVSCTWGEFVIFCRLIHLDILTPQANKRKQEALAAHGAEESHFADVLAGPWSCALVHTSTAKGPNGAKKHTMSPRKRHPATRENSKRHLLTAHERLARDCCQAQHAAKVLEQALEDLGLPKDLVARSKGACAAHTSSWGKSLE